MSDTIEPTDEDIAKRVQDGDTDAFGILMDRYQAKLLRYGRRFIANESDIEDRVQDVFIKAYQNMKGFDTSRRFSPWIYRIAHNAFVNALREKSRTPITTLDLDAFVGHASADDLIEEHDRERMRAVVEKGIERLPSAYKEIVFLYYVEDLEYQEIADVLRIPVGTVGVRLKRARERLKKDLGGSGVL